LGRISLTEDAFKFLKYLEISFTSLGDLVGIESGSLLILAGTVLDLFPLFPLFIDLAFRVHLKETFYLKGFLLLSAWRESYPDE